MPRKLYIETRLFNINDRLASLDLCERMESWIAQGLLADMEPQCFLPYRDNPIPKGVAPKKIGRWIFEEDAEMLDRCAGVVGYFDGAHYDQGCAFEVGCAYAWGYPINLISTDFYVWSVGSSPAYFVGSKLLEHVAKIVRITDQDLTMSYRERSEDQLERNIAAFKANLIEDFGTVKPPAPRLEALPVETDYYIDPGFQYTEAGRMLLAAIKVMIEDAGKTYVLGNNRDDIDEDITHLRKSGQAIIYADAFEPHVDSSLLHGIAYGIGRKAIVYCSNQHRYTAGPLGDTASCGVMLLYSAETAVASLSELGEVIAKK